MSKYVKGLMIEQFREDLDGVEEAVILGVTGMPSNMTTDFRAELRKESLHLRVVKNTLARLATRGTPLEPAFDGLEGPAAVLWGDDIVALAKRALKIVGEEKYKKYVSIQGGAIGGERIAADEVEGVSKWPSRGELLSTISGQILGVGATLSAQLIGTGGTLSSQLTSVGGALASQIAKKAEGAEAETSA